MQDEIQFTPATHTPTEDDLLFFASSLSVAKNQLFKELISSVQSENFGY